MTKITSVLFSFVIGLTLGPYCHAGDFTASYHECLKLERAKIEKVVKESCGREGDADPDSNAQSFASCLERGKSNQLSEAANKQCHDKAMVSSGLNGGASANKARVIPPVEEYEEFYGVFTPPDSARAPKATAPTKNGGEKTKSQNPGAIEDNNLEAAAKKQKSRSPPPISAGADFDSTLEAEIQADQDIARCATAASGANECCNNPLACSDQLNRADSNSLGALGAMLGNGAQTGGLSDYCRQMNTLSGNSGNVNTGLASICFGSHATCSTTCGGLADKYADLIAECDGCDEHGIYENAQRNLTTSKYTCTNLRTRSDQLAVNGLGTANNQAVADYCNKVAGTGGGDATRGLTPPSSNSPFINHLLAYNCDANPNSPDCKAMDLRAAAARGESGFRESQKKNADFNIPDPANGFKGYGGNEAPGTQSNEAGRAANIPKVGTVANNTGGQVGGGSGGSQSSATLTPKSKAGTSGGGHNTAVEQGFQGGNGYSQPVAAQNNDDHSPYGGGRNLPSTDKQFENLDLRQFLPGGSRAAMRRLAGNGEINPKEENLFLRISNKMKEKCRLGVLWQCR